LANGGRVGHRQGAFGQPPFRRRRVENHQAHETTTYPATWNLRDQSGALVPPVTYRITGRLLTGRDSVIVSVADVEVVIAR